MCRGVGFGAVRCVLNITSKIENPSARVASLRSALLLPPGFSGNFGEWKMGTIKRVWLVLVAFAMSLLAVPAFADGVVDITAVTAGITAAQVALLAVLAGLIGLSAAIFGVAKVYAFLKRKAGA